MPTRVRLTTQAKTKTAVRMLRCLSGGKGKPGQCKKLTTARCRDCGRPFCGHHAKNIHPDQGGLPNAKTLAEHQENLAKGFKVLCSRCISDPGWTKTTCGHESKIVVSVGGRLRLCPPCADEMKKETRGIR